MDQIPELSALALPATALLMLCWLGLYWRRRRHAQAPKREQRRLGEDREAPQATRVLSSLERLAHDRLRAALPGYLVLAQVPLTRFVKLGPQDHRSSGPERASTLVADLLLCSAQSRVLAVIDVRPVDETDRSRRRHERMAQVLRSAGIAVHVWREESMPSIEGVRLMLAGVLGRKGLPPVAAASRPVPLIPVAETQEMAITEVRAAIEATLAADSDFFHEPVPSGFYEEMEAAPVARRFAGLP